ncbi:hypothetical protein WJX73_006085 [Symbiochloris irregularis]|uniref:Uncharacterized protein n=1 Tax=Symbiochloris irregularis TaxID=706552 RepID=A0AAW1Q1W4_9CHLO
MEPATGEDRDGRGQGRSHDIWACNIICPTSPEERYGGCTEQPSGIPGAGMMGCLILRMLQSVRVLVRLGMPKPSLHGALPVAQGTPEPEDAAALDRIAQQTGALRQALSEVIATIEAAIPAPVPGQNEGVGRVLPPGAASVRGL